MKLLLIRGLPGSGKSTMAKAIQDENGKPYFHIEADMYFVDAKGVYSFDQKKIGLAHDWCQRGAAEALEKGDNVVVANTFVRLWEIAPYRIMAEKLGADFQVIEATGNYQNVHNVPEHVLERMKTNWEAL